ncbi:pseudouridine synthase [Marinoscillum sp. MHG1-6]|uniref:pseudouridine synthase n=1 Tax=Marinoscillum sp. MHG1-6 TaxID=2959627 RepID=UPI0021581F71|nr:pseudouridine synthase [Marinoscillum sp. MHG1-6]
MIEIIYRDEFLVAINKPPGLLVHRSPIAKDATEFAVQRLREQLGQHVYPAHRLDRKTSGVLVFGLSSEINSTLQQLFQNKNVVKKYLAIVRGFTKPSGTIDYALRRDDGKLQDAITHYHTISQTELAVPFGKHPTSRYSLIEAQPETGRMHQLRKHFAHIFHPIIADRPHGCNKQNRLFKEKWNMDTMMLHASELSFPHPATNQLITMKAPIQSEFQRTLDFLKLNIPGN